MLRIDRIGLRISGVFERVVPDPFVIAVFLTLLTAAVALLFGDWPGANEDDSTIVALLDSWRGSSGLWAFLLFAMQMCLILVTGYALAESAPIRSLITRLVALPRSTAQAAALVGFVACIFGVINWGLGLIVGALLARDVGRALHARGIKAHYPLIVAAGYLGLLVWHGGLSGSAPLKASTQKELIDTFFKSDASEENIAALTRLGVENGVPLTDTIASPMNLAVTGGMIVIIPLLMMLFAPKNESDRRDITQFAALKDKPRAEDDDSHHPKARSIPDLLFASPIVAWLLAIPLLLAFWRYWDVSGLGRLGPNEIIALMFGIGLLCHSSLRTYALAAEDGAKACAGIILQFPLYAGIMGMLSASGLILAIAAWFAAIGNETTVPLLTYVSAALVNLFVPSGGGQWGIQGLIALETAHQTGAPPGKMIMAVAYGDELTNMLQPFWALPLLGIAGVKARDIVGYTAIIMFAAAAIMAAGLLAFA